MKDFERWLSKAALNPRRPHLDRLGLVLDSTLVYRGLGPAWICPDLGLFLDIFVMAPYNYHSHKARIVLSVHIFLRNTMKNLRNIMKLLQGTSIKVDSGCPCVYKRCEHHRLLW